MLYLYRPTFFYTQAPKGKTMTAPKRKIALKVTLGVTVVLLLGLALSQFLQVPEEKAELLPPEAPATVEAEAEAEDEPDPPVAEDSVPPAVAERPFRLPDEIRESSESEIELIKEAEAVLELLLGDVPVVRRMKATKKMVFNRPHTVQYPGAGQQPVLSVASSDTIVLAPLLFQKQLGGRHSRLLAVLYEESYSLLEPAEEKVEAAKLGGLKNVEVRLRPKLRVLQLLDVLKDQSVAYKWRQDLSFTRNALKAQIQAIDPNVLN